MPSTCIQCLLDELWAFAFAKEGRHALHKSK